MKGPCVMVKSCRLVMFFGAMMLSVVAGIALLKPSMNFTAFPPYVSLLAAAAALAGGVGILSNRFRIPTVVVILLCIGGAVASIRQRNAMAAEEAFAKKMKELVTPRVLPHLAIGSPAPEIAGSDLSGRKMTLSEYRGKVVLLVFWYSACGPCMGDVPHERELVDRFNGLPFVVIGVNTDASTAIASAAVKKHSIPWNSFWDGGDGGPIATHWGVQAFPTVYIIDDAGVIRHNDLRGDALDAPLQRMIAAAQERKRLR